jgi:O-antigen/teichoic acid export membrane protein
MLSLAWDCLPLIAIICPMIADFAICKIKAQRTPNQSSTRMKFQEVFLMALAAAATGFVLCFLAVFLYQWGFKGALPVVILVFLHMAAVFTFYKRIAQSRNQKKTQRKVYKAISISAAIIVSGILLLPLIFSFDFTIFSMAICSPAAIYAFYKLATQQLQNQKSEELTARLFLSICLVAAGFIVAFPPTNMWVSLVAGSMRLEAMERFIGASTETFVAVFGQPDSQSETQLGYSHVPCYSYDLPDDDIAIIIEDNKMKACISH